MIKKTYSTPVVEVEELVTDVLMWSGFDNEIGDEDWGDLDL